MNTDPQNPNPSNRPGDPTAERIEEVPSTAQPLPVWPATQDTYRTNTPPATETTGPATAPPVALRELKIADIGMDACTQVRAKIIDKVVGEYAERMMAGDQFPPADVFFDGKGYYVADGFHRLLGAQRAKLPSYPCTVHPGGPEQAMWFGLAANTRHGLRLTSADKRHAIEMALGKFPEKTQDQIALQIGCHRSYVTKVAGQLVNCHKLNVPATRKGKDGKVRPTRYRKTKRTAPQQASSHAVTAASTSQPPGAQMPTDSESVATGTVMLNPEDREFVDSVQRRFEKWMDRWAVADHPRIRNILIGLLKG